MPYLLDTSMLLRHTNPSDLLYPVAAGVTGKQVHDARLIAICQVYGITNILTFNVRHFTRMAAFVPGLVIVDPASIL